MTICDCSCKTDIKLDFLKVCYTKKLKQFSFQNYSIGECVSKNIYLQLCLLAIVIILFGITKILLYTIKT